jgi:hypothetical protein
MRNSSTRHSGMSTLGTAVVSIIILVVAAIAIPSFLTSRQTIGSQTATAIESRADEVTAISALRTISSAEASYSATDGMGSYGTLADLHSSGLIDQSWTLGSIRNGYRFELILDSPGNKTFCATAESLSNKTGSYSYAVSQQGAIYRLAGDTAPTCDADTGTIAGPAGAEQIQ